jgi:hypothetical protein
VPRFRMREAFCTFTSPYVFMVWRLIKLKIRRLHRI